MSSQGAALAAMLQSNFTDGFAVEASLQRALLASTGASDGLVVPNVSIAMWLVSHTLREAGMVEEIVLPRAACVRLPTSASAGGVQLRSVLDATRVGVREIGSSADCEREDYRKAFTHAKQLLIVTSPSRPEDHCEAGIAIAREASGLICELAFDACQHDLAGIGVGVRALSRRWDRGPDLIVAPGQFLLGGPECGIVLGKRELVTAIRQVAETLGMLCDRLTAALLCQALLEGESESAWLATPTPAALTTSIENLEHRARRIAAQSDVSDAIEKIEVHRMPLRLGAGVWQNVRLESGVLRVYPRGMRPSSLADALASRRIPIWCNVGSESVELAMRTIEPVEDALVVDALLQPQQSPEPRPAESRSPEPGTGSSKVVGKEEPS
jgi:L-seryl-tRNA(Ser) seleniumtransferase